MAQAVATAAPKTVEATAVRPSPGRSLIVRIGERYNVDPDKLLVTLKATAFRQRADRKTGEVREPSNEEMMALLVIADQYRLNPFTRELFAYFDPKSGAIVPIVSVDGWIRIINEQPTLRSIKFSLSPETVEHKGKTCHVWMECAITRSDRDDPIVIREYFNEVVRLVDFATPWDSHPNRMHRHKTLIQCARVAFGFGGIYDPDEAERIIEGIATHVPDVAPAVQAINAAVTGKPAIEHRPTESVPTDTGAKDAELVASGQTFAEIADRINKAESEDAVDIALDAGRDLPDNQRAELADIAAQRSWDITPTGKPAA